MTAQVRNHGKDQAMHDPLRKRVKDAVLDAMGDIEKLAMPLLKDDESLRSFSYLILTLLSRPDGFYTL
ncbi:hypothetical protein P8631_00230 [Guyparkeria sp. 1SP6A2]|nr:hypothetical protein [Guyparkeria sp. 1SP6A2]